MARLRGANLIILVLVAFAQCFGAIACAQTQADYLRGIFSTPSTYDPSPIRLRLGDDDYDIPKNALFAFPSNGGRQRAVLLQLLYPEMEGLTRANNVEMRRLRQNSRRIQVLISDYSINPYPQSGLKAVSTVYSVRVTMRARNGAAIAEVDDPQLEMRKVTVSPANGHPWDIFADPKERDGERSYVAECYRIEDVPNPQCSLSFAYRNLLVEASFPRSRLPEWQSIRAVVSRWMDERRVQGKVRQGTGE